MQYRQLGRSGLKVSPICLGTMMFGGPTTEATSTRIIAKAREAGINFIDTADAYNGGGSEEVVGRAIANNRQAWVLATKLANPMGDDPNRSGLSRRWVLAAADESLKRLGTDSAECCAFSGGPFVESRYFGEGIGIAVRKGNDLLRQSLNWALFRLWEKGRYTDLWLRYFSISPF